MASFDPLYFVNLILSVIIVVISLVAYRLNKSEVSLYIAIGFGFFGFSHLLFVVGLGSALENYLIIVRIAAYLIIIFGVYTSWKQVKTHISTLKDKNKELMQEITERKKAEAALKKARDELEIKVKERTAELEESEIKYRTMFEYTGTATVIIEEDSTLSLVNTEFEKLSGYSKEELENMKNWMEFVIEDDLNKMRKYHSIRRDKKAPVPLNYEFRFIDRDKNVKNIYLTAVLIPGTRKSLASLIDITDRKIAENELKKSLEEKEMLLKEIHHRAKNNLIVISSLLNLQSGYIKDEGALDIFKESQNRAKSMALIHERLYQSTDSKRIDFGDYIHSLAVDMFHSYAMDTTRIKLNIDVEDIMLDVNTAVPLGLILNELLSNAMKYAFPDEMGGDIKVDFHRDGDEFILAVSDNGVGLPEDLDFKNTESLGFQLVNNLTSQIGGQIELDRTSGVKFIIRFEELEL